MIAASELAGFFTAHAVWSVSEGDPLAPMLVYTDASGERRLERLTHPDAAAAIHYGRQRMTANDMDAEHAALIYADKISSDTKTADALLLELRAYDAPNTEAVFAVPYTPLREGQFKIHPARVVAWSDTIGITVDRAFEAFFDGVSRHEKGAEIWAACRAESG